MGLVLSAVITYAGLHETVETVRHLVRGVVPYQHPGFEDLVEYYTRELQKSTKQANDWTTACGQGYLCLNEENGKVSGAGVKYYHTQPDSTAILFCTKISSFGDSVEEPVANGDCKKERYSPAKTKTLVLNTTTETITVANRNKSPGPDTQAANSPERRETDDAEDKLTWQYNPLDSTPEIHFESYDDDKPGFITEDYLRSLDGIKFRPLQRSDPSGRRRGFRKRSSSSNSSKESRASRDEELQMFTSLEEAEFGAAQASSPQPDFGSAPNLTPHSFRSQSRERRTDWSTEASVDSTDDDKLKETESLDEQAKDKEVIEEEDDIDFWGNSSD